MDEPQPQDPESRAERYRDIRVRTPDWRLHSGRILRVNNDSVAIGFEETDAPDVDEHVLVTLIFHPCEGGQLVARGHLIEEKSETPGERHLDFRFAAPHPVFLAAIDSHDATETTAGNPNNRRRAYRVIPKKRCTEVLVRPAVDRGKSMLRQLTDVRFRLERSSVVGWMTDLSADGIGVLVQDSEAHRYEEGDQVTLTFSLTEGPEPLILGAVVRQCRHVRIGTRYGFRFDRGTTEQYRLMQRTVLEFVMRLQRDRLRSRSGTG